MPRIRTVFGVVRQRPEEGGRQVVQVGLCFTYHIAADEFGGILEHVDEAVQFTQHVVGDMHRGACLAVEENRNVLVAAANFLDEGAQAGDRGFGLAVPEVFVVDRQDERRGAALLLGKRRQVAVAGHPECIKALLLDCLGQRPDTQTAGVLRTVVLVDDDYREVEMHGQSSTKSGVMGHGEGDD